MSERTPAKGRRGALVLVTVLVLSLLLGVGVVMSASGSHPSADDARSVSADVPASGGLSSIGEIEAGRRPSKSRRPEPVELPPDTDSHARTGGRTDDGTGAAAAVITTGETPSKDVGAEAPPAAAPADPAPAPRTARTRGGSLAVAARTLIVHVTAAESKEPLADVEVTVKLADQNPATLRTGTGGLAAFAATGVTSGSIDVKSPGRLRVKLGAVAISPPETTVEVVLERGVIVRGVVTGPKGPIRGATVRVVDWKALLASYPYSPEPAPIETATTERGGAYRLDCMPRGIECALLVEAPGCARACRRIEPQPDVDFLLRKDVVLGAGRDVAGVVRDAGGRPARGALVLEMHVRDAAISMYQGSRDRIELELLDSLRDVVLGGATPPRRTVTGEDGGFRLTVPADGTVLLMAFDSRLGRSPPSGALKPGADAGVLELRGRIRAEFEFRKPDSELARSMTIAPHFPWDRWSVSQLPSGRYGHADMEVGPVAVDVSGPDGAPGTYAGSRVDETSVVWTARLKAGITWHGRVIDAMRQPIEGAKLSAGPVSTLSDAKGEFVLEGVHPYSLWLDATAEGMAWERVLVKRTNESVEVRMSRVFTLRLKALLPAGAAPPGWFRVSRGAQGEIGGGSQPVWEDREGWNDGRIEIPGWSRLRERFTLFVPGYELVNRELPAMIELAREPLEVPLKRAGEMRGVVIDEDGEPVPGAEVSIALPDADANVGIPERSVDCDAKGEFRIGTLTESVPCEFRVRAPGFMETPQVCRATPEPQQVVIGRGHEFRGRWTIVGDREVTAILVGPLGEAYARVRVQRDGSFEAVVPRRPREVNLWDLGATSPSQRLRRVPIPESHAEGDVFVIE